MQEVQTEPKTYKSKPRAIVFKSNNESLRKITEFIETQCPDAEIIYITSAPASTILRIVREPSADCCTEPYYTIE
ncbi:MAG: hypothetical protein NWE98_06370 [Candidatus Bathyarchaeota archaeon]|nr:hypothetical protein [Candidatus Bathyarchaeota archaeon]